MDVCAQLCVCASVCVPGHIADARGQPQVSVLVFCLVWDRLFTILYTQQAN